MWYLVFNNWYDLHLVGYYNHKLGRTILIYTLYTLCG